jgi:hypothetical protein
MRVVACVVFGMWLLLRMFLNKAIFWSVCHIGCLELVILEF